MANKRANHRTPKPDQGPIKIRCKDGILRATTTFPLQRKDAQGVQHPVEGIEVNGLGFRVIPVEEKEAA